jgi:hypothetical protein
VAVFVSGKGYIAIMVSDVDSAEMFCKKENAAVAGCMLSDR